MVGREGELATIELAGRAVRVRLNACSVTRLLPSPPQGYGRRWSEGVPLLRVLLLPYEGLRVNGSQGDLVGH